HVARYEKGERNYQGRWLPAAEEQALRSDLKRGWRVESEHYVVTTNHSLEGGVALVRRVGNIPPRWRPGVVACAPTRRRLEGRAPRKDTKQHQVVYFRDRDEYNRALRSSQPKIDMTLGIYFDQPRTAYFFAGDEQEAGTLFHEATHQLFHESRAVADQV